MPDSELPQPVTLPSFYADSAHVVRQEFTIHLLLGHLDLRGDIAPGLHVHMSREFCRHLGQQLLAAAESADDR